MTVNSKSFFDCRQRWGLQIPYEHGKEQSVHTSPPLAPTSAHGYSIVFLKKVNGRYYLQLTLVAYTNGLGGCNSQAPLRNFATTKE
jgi:hypothetical protein